jgi:hypothetical protein
MRDEHDWGAPTHTRKQGQPFEKGIGGANKFGRIEILCLPQQSAQANGLPFALRNHFGTHI